ncbi:MAG TPA: hypothetical protein VK621_25570 [Bradyrhizobium sp.]|nr:hypothetical protein [Bradyrhizobium sp.]
MFVTLCGSLALLARLLTAALLLAGLLSRRLIRLAGLVLFLHGVSFRGKHQTNGPQFRFVPDKEEMWLAAPLLCQPDIFRLALKFLDHHANTQSPPNEQAGTRVWKQPLTTRIIDSVLNKTREP